MAKRAIYLDDRERDLARRVFSVVIELLNNSYDKRVVEPHEYMAFKWTRRELEVLADKFAEPISDDHPA